MVNPDLGDVDGVTVSGRPGSTLVPCLLLLGVGAQLWLSYEMRYDLPVLMHGDPASVLAEILINFSPIILALAGAALATWLGRRRSRWAILVARVPCVILVLGLGLAVYLTFNPISFDHH